jgi:hypothetical protein
MTKTMSENLQGGREYASRALRVWQGIEAQPGLSLAWQVATFIAAFVAIFSRLPGALLHPQFFAEDGWVWYQQAYNLHWLPSLGTAQAGYMQTLPRLVAGVSLLFPMRWAPLIMNLAGTVIQVLPVTALLSRRCAPWGPLSARMWMAALYIAIPDAPEIHVVLTNAMWHLAVLQVLLAFSIPPLSWRGRVSDLVLFCIGGISGPFCILLLPLIAAYWWFRRQRWTVVVLGVMFLGAVIQVVTILHAVKRPGAPLGVTPLRLLRIVGGSIFIDSMVGTGGPNLPIPFLLLGAIGGLAILFWGWRSAPLPVRLYFVFALLVLMASLRDPLLLPGSTPRWEVLADAAGIRYWFFPSLMFLWSAVWCALKGRITVMRYAGTAVLLLTTVGLVRKWIYPPWPESHFSAEVERFNQLKAGEHMVFPVYDPGGRTMELIKR